jgi:hypothetical protein
MRRISTKIALPLLLGIASTVAVACGEENPNPDGEGGSGNSANDIGDGGGEPPIGSGGRNTDGTGGGSTDGSGGGNTDGSGGGGGEGGGTGSGGGSGGTPIGPGEENDLPDCTDATNGTFPGGDNPIEGEDCWNFTLCEGKETEQFLNQCSGTCLEPFDNVARIEDFNGTLPPL